MAVVDLVHHDVAVHVVARLVEDGIRVAVIGEPIPGAELVIPRSVASVADDLAAAIARVELQLGSLSVLVCGAVTPPRGRFVATPATDWFANVSQALFTPFALIRAAVPALSRSGHSRIVVVGSAWAAADLPVATASAAVQGALVALMKTLSRDLGPRGITVNEVAVADDEAISPQSMAIAISYLAGPNAGSMTGQIMNLGSGGDIRP
ncbi:SDR family oxidoreductase [Cryobacterium sp. CG_9.6]|uniref:SDR family NAD(P)-dependent oxidoreductase n=1 Tax=Cryobacterium sp. CG_9.6 TaxID=2760710 RepID=UPI002474A278|nr:SDR family oxidoreductase [Cryobacterium sp. CG_9.6]MDH6236726.1 NAD(P)-dependent dehydrogenase (short-subunit alcohol dehydrogenase family) [Cryobacterium sp. CG_9.6]